MTQPDHLTEEQFAQYRSRSLAAVKLLAVDEHIAQCGECRDRLYREERVDSQLRHLRAEFIGHLDYDQIAACAHGSFPPDVAQHLADCAMCRAEVDDLAQFRDEIKSAPRAPIEMPRRRSPWPFAVAAAVLLAAGGLAWYLRQTPMPSPGVAVAPKPPVSDEPPLTADQKSALQLALDTHKLAHAPILDSVQRKQGVLLGPPGAGDTKGFDLLSPIGTTVLTDRPVFAWMPAPGATSYLVAVYDENFEKVLESPPVSVTEWQPDTPLPRGRIYNWQVTTEIGGHTVHAPIPPAPEARFQVVPQETAGQIETARRVHPANHLLLAALCAQAGALDDARKELDQLAATDPGTAAALRDSLK